MIFGGPFAVPMWYFISLGLATSILTVENPPLAAELNVVGSDNVAEACFAEGVGRLVYASTW